MYCIDDELYKCTIKKGDLVLCNGGDVGRAAIWNFDEEICYQNHVSRLRSKITEINNKLYLYLLMFYKEQGMLNGKGVGITSLSAKIIMDKTGVTDLKKFFLIVTIPEKSSDITCSLNSL